MLRSFCDKCERECDPRASGTRRYGELMFGAEEGRWLGLEVVPLYEDAPSSGNHVCEDCLAEMLLAAFSAISAAPAVHRYNALLAASEDYAQLKRQLEQQLAAAHEKSDKAAGQIRAYEKFMEEARQKSEADADQIAELMVQLNAAQAIMTQKRGGKGARV